MSFLLFVIIPGSVSGRLMIPSQFSECILPTWPTTLFSRLLLCNNYRLRRIVWPILCLRHAFRRLPAGQHTLQPSHRLSRAPHHAAMMWRGAVRVLNLSCLMILPHFQQRFQGGLRTVWKEIQWPSNTDRGGAIEGSPPALAKPIGPATMCNLRPPNTRFAFDILSWVSTGSVSSPESKAVPLSSLHGHRQSVKSATLTWRAAPYQQQAHCRNDIIPGLCFVSCLYILHVLGQCWTWHLTVCSTVLSDYL